MGIKPEDIQRAIADGNKVLQQLRRVCPKADDPPLTTKKRIRQSSKPLSNKLETEFGAWLHGTYPLATIAEQAITFRLANGVKYTPDWIVFGNIFVSCFEVKGKHTWDDAIVKVKVAASLYPDIRWLMVWKLNGEWMMQSVLP